MSKPTKAEVFRRAAPLLCELAKVHVLVADARGGNKRPAPSVVGEPGTFGDEAA